MEKRDGGIRFRLEQYAANFLVGFGTASHLWFWAIWISAVLTMCIGNFAALAQTNVKRMLAYSSIAHAGYILVAFAASTVYGIAAVLFYLAAYALMKVGAFLVIAHLGQRDEQRSISRTTQDWACNNLRWPHASRYFCYHFWDCRQPADFSENSTRFRPRSIRASCGWWLSRRLTALSAPITISACHLDVFLGSTEGITLHRSDSGPRPALSSPPSARSIWASFPATSFAIPASAASVCLALH